MKLQKILIVGLLATAFSGLTAGASQAHSCAEGYELPDGDTMTSCVPVEAVAFTATDGEAIDPEPTLYTEDTPAVDANGCWIQTDADGNSVEACAKSVDMAPIDADVDPGFGCGTVTDENGVEMPVCADGVLTGEEMYQTGIPEMRNDIPLIAMNGSDSSESSSNTLAALGVLVAALGAFGIGLSNQRAAKK